MTQKNKGHPGLLWMALGLLLLAGALGLVAYNVYEEAQARMAAGAALVQLEAELPPATVYRPVPSIQTPEAPAVQEEDIPNYIRYPDMEMPTVEVDGQAYLGVLELPALELTLPILSSWSYPQLKLAPCRYSGSSYLGDLILLGHNYQSHFAALKNLQPGDEVRFTDADGNLFTYEVTSLLTLEATAVEEMEAGSDDSWDLTLFTCTVGGQARLAVRCAEVTETE